MIRSALALSVAISAAGVGMPVFGQVAQGVAAAPDGVWTRLAEMPPAVEAGEPWVRAKPSLALTLDRATLAAQLAGAPHEDVPGAAPVRVTIPTPDGRWAAYDAVESPVMAPELQAQFPEIRTYWARGVDDPYAIARFDLTPAGFHAMIIAPDDAWTGGSYAIDPYTRGDDVHYSSYWRRDYAVERAPFQCLTAAEPAPKPVPGDQSPTLNRSGAERRTFRLAVSTTGEFTAFHGGTVAGGLAAVVTAVNRISGIYDIDLAIRLQLVANNDLLINTSAATDPFTSPGANTTTLDANQARLDTVIGNGNYDVGHVFHRGSNNGVAGAIGNVCVSAGKGRGVSVTDPPTGDLLAVDYVAHELGHQFNGRHSFNNCSGSQGDSGTLALELGSGTTIMGYAGICGATNIATASDPDFHAQSIDQIISYTTVGGVGYGCPVRTATGNSAPVVTVAQRSFNIPSGTPFSLTATATDPNGNPLTYDWEQMDASAVQNSVPLSGSETSGPMFRSFPASASPTRFFPRFSDVLANTTSIGERLPTGARQLNFRCTVRDGLGGVADTFNSAANPTEIRVTTTAAGPFSVTAPNTNVTWSGVRTVTWNVASSNAAPVSCAAVDILLSTDGGNNFSTVLASGVPNNGSASVLLPNLNSTTARVMVRAVGNIFYDVSNVNFTITPPPNFANFEAVNNGIFTDNTGNGNGNSVMEPGESDIRLTLPLRNVGGVLATGVSATLVSNTPTVTISNAVQSYPNITALGGTASNPTPFVLNISSAHPCGATVSLTLNVTSAQGNTAIPYTLTTGLGGGTGPDQTFTYAGPPVPIPDVSTVNVDFSVAGFSGTIQNARFRFNGSVCNANVGSTTVGLDHTYVGDLIITLRSPIGTIVTLANRDGVGGNNFCNTVFDDAAATSIASITAGQAPFTGSFRPDSPLSVFNGQNPNGVWRLTVQDAAGQDIGNIRNFSLVLVGPNPPVCQPPVAGPTCFVDFNDDGVLNQEDLAGYLTAFLDESIPSGPSGTSIAPCPGAPVPYNTLGYAADYSRDCSLDQDDLSQFLTEYLMQVESPNGCIPG